MCTSGLSNFLSALAANSGPPTPHSQNLLNLAFLSIHVCHEDNPVFCELRTFGIPPPPTETDALKTCFSHPRKKSRERGNHALVTVL